MANGFAERANDLTRRGFFGILGVKVNYQSRAGSGYWSVVGHLVVLRYRFHW